MKNNEMFKKLRKLRENNKGVSEVVAVLILVAVVIVGAIGVGTIMSSFSTQVSQQASAGDVGKNAGTELLIAGSTTVQPLSECLAKLYMKQNPGVRVTVQGGGSGAGIAAVGQNLVDIGASSKSLSTTDLAKYPTLQVKQIGGSAVVLIGSAGCGDPTGTINSTDVKAVYTGNSTTMKGVTVDKAYQRADSSGTEETFAKWMKYQDSATKQIPADSTADAVTGNAGVLNAVKSAPSGKCYIGFVDYGFAASETGIKMYNVTRSDGTGSFKPTADNIKKALSGIELYPNSETDGLTRPLLYITNGNPSSIAQSFMTFAVTPGEKKDLNGKPAQTAAGCFEETGYFPIWEI